MGVSGARRRSELLTVAAHFTIVGAAICGVVIVASGGYGGVLIVGLALAVGTSMLSDWTSATPGSIVIKAVNSLFALVALGVCVDTIRRMV